MGTKISLFTGLNSKLVLPHYGCVIFCVQCYFCVQCRLTGCIFFQTFFLKKIGGDTLYFIFFSLRTDIVFYILGETS